MADKSRHGMDERVAIPASPETALRELIKVALDEQLVSAQERNQLPITRLNEH